MEIDGFLYETLSPLSSNVAASTIASTPPPAPSSPTPSDSEPYLVLRNHIPISTNSTPLPETSAPEFFSLDVDADDWRTPTPPLKRSRLATPLPDEEPTRSLEAGWFRANCRFKSPMLQLHKGIVLPFCFKFDTFWLIRDLALYLQSNSIVSIVKLGGFYHFLNWMNSNLFEITLLFTFNLVSEYCLYNNFNG